MTLHYTQSGFLIIRPYDNIQGIIDAMLETGYSEEFCVSPDFDPEFVARLMRAGFLVMSTRLDDGFFILLPKLHLTRSILFFENLHIKKSIRRHLNRYELRFNTDFNTIVDHCVATHGADWLTPPLVAALRNIRKHYFPGIDPVSFALYENEKLVAGEFGVVAGKMYTSYSGYHDQSNAGTAQLILTTRYLQEHHFAFFDLGMPMEYKTSLGAENLDPREFVPLFRAAYTPHQFLDNLQKQAVHCIHEKNNDVSHSERNPNGFLRHIPSC